MVISISIDAEPDIHANTYKGIYIGIPSLLKILDRYNIKVTFFVTCDCIENYPKIFQKLKKQGHEIALHGYRHKRFDELSLNEKEDQIKKSIKCFRKYLKENPRGFRAPQHSIDNGTLNLLEKYGFNYDSSYTPLNFLQLLFFPKKFKLWFKHFSSSLKIFKIRRNLCEIPPTSFIFPFVSLAIRIFPLWFLRKYIDLLTFLTPNIIFYAHSWDFIELPNSKIARFCPKEKFEKKLRLFLDYSTKRSNYIKMKDLYEKFMGKNEV